MIPCRLVLVGCMLLALPACSQLQVASAGEVGCAPKDIEVSEVERKWGTEAWRAGCGERVFQCSSVATAQAVDYSCAPLDEAPPPKADLIQEDLADEDSADEGLADVEPDGEEAANGAGEDAAADDDAASSPDEAEPGEGGPNETDADEAEGGDEPDPSDPPSDTGR